MAAPRSPGRRSPWSGLARSGVAAARLCAARGRAGHRHRPARRGRAGRGRSPRSRAPRAPRARRPRPAPTSPAPTWWWSRPGVPLALPEHRRRRAPPACRCGARSSSAARFLAGDARGRRSPAPTARAPPPRSPARCSPRDRRTFAGGNLGTPLCEHVLSGAAADVARARALLLPARGHRAAAAARRRHPERHPRPPRPLPRRRGLRRGQGAPLREPAAGRLRGGERPRPGARWRWRAPPAATSSPSASARPPPPRPATPAASRAPPGPSSCSRSRPARRSATGVAQPGAARPAQPGERHGRGRSARASLGVAGARCRPGSTPSPACPTGSSSSPSAAGWSG